MKILGTVTFAAFYIQQKVGPELENPLRWDFFGQIAVKFLSPSVPFDSIQSLVPVQVKVTHKGGVLTQTHIWRRANSYVMESSGACKNAKEIHQGFGLLIWPIRNRALCNQMKESIREV